MPKKSTIYLEHIIEAIEHIQEFVKEMGYDDFERSLLVQSAVIRQLEIVGEASSQLLKLDSQMVHRIPKVPWRLMISMRNKLIHEYMGVQVDLVWETLKESLPEVKYHIHYYLKGR